MIGETVHILLGEHAGQRAFVTWMDGKYLRATPLDGDPLASIELLVGEVERVTDQSGETE